MFKAISSLLGLSSPETQKNQISEKTKNEPDALIEKPVKTAALELTAASIPGTDHTMPGKPLWKNNQDAYAFEKISEGFAIAVICDGCGSGKCSEVGSNLAAKKLLIIIKNELKINPSIENINWRKIKQQLIAYILTIAEGLNSDLIKIIQDYFLFTIVGFLVTKDNVCIFNIGDGVYGINDEIKNFGPFPDNAPPYLMYEITGTSATFGNELLDFQVVILPRNEVDTLFIGCDGVEDLVKCAEKKFPGTEKPIGEIQQLFEIEGMFSNPDRLRRHLALINKEMAVNSAISAGLLPDDTTLVLARLSNY